MGVKARKGGDDYEIMPQDTHIAVCYGVIDLGTQRAEFKGKEKIQHKAIVLFETPNCTTEYEDEEMPMVISKEYTLSTSDRSNLYKDLMGWRGRALTQEEMEEFDMSVLIGKGCQLQVVHQVSKKTGNTYAKINAIIKPPTGVEIPRSVRQPIDYELTEGYIPEDIPEWIQEKIKASLEWTGEKPFDTGEVEQVPDEISGVEPF